MKKILISSFDMEVGGVERSLISMLDNFDYESYDVDLMLYSHSGDFFHLVTDKVTLLPEEKKLATFRKGIGEVIKQGHIAIGISRLIAKVNSNIRLKLSINNSESVLQMQLMWRYALPFLPRIKKNYDVAISYLWPHYFVAEKVNAKVKIAWIHTDYSNIETNIKTDLKMWDQFNYIMSVSEACKNSFLKKYPTLKNKVRVMENITSPDFIKKMANDYSSNEMIDDKSFKILTVARLSHAKGIDNAVRAFKVLRDRGVDNIKWYVIGYGGDELLIKDLIKENNLENSFVLLGKKINPYPYIRECNLYVQPSRYEGKAVTVLEAQILGKPVIITNYTTAKSQVENKVDGYIAELSVEGIANTIEKLYKNKEIINKLAKKCSEHNYGNKDEINKLYELINKI